MCRNCEKGWFFCYVFYFVRGEVIRVERLRIDFEEVYIGDRRGRIFRGVGVGE